MQASKLDLQGTHPALVVSSILYEPNSSSLALMYSDTSILLYTSSASSSSSAVSFKNPNFIPPPNSSVSFVQIRSRSRGENVLFLCAKPERGGGVKTHLKSWVFRKNGGEFAPARMGFGRKQGERDEKSGVLIDLVHGFSVRITGGVNFAAAYSFSARKILVLGVKLWEDEEVGLTKCMVIDCVVPVFSMRVSVEHLILGEEGGVRVFNLRVLGKSRKDQGKLKGLKIDKLKRKEAKSSKEETTTTITENKSERIEMKDGTGGLKVYENGYAKIKFMHGEIDLGRNSIAKIASDSSGNLKHVPKNGMIKSVDMKIPNLNVKMKLENGVPCEFGRKRVGKESIQSGMLDCVGGICMNDKRGNSSVDTDGHKERGMSTKDRNQEHEKVTPIAIVDVNDERDVLEKANDVPAKAQTLKLKQDSGDLGSCFVHFRSPEVVNQETKMAIAISQRAVSILVLSQRRFLILDSMGKMHILSLSHAPHKPASGHTSSHLHALSIMPIDYAMKVQTVAVHPDASTIWVSDGRHSVHVITMPGEDDPVEESENNKGKDIMLHLTASEVIFTSEKIQELVTFGENAALVLCQGKVFSYSVPCK